MLERSQIPGVNQQPGGGRGPKLPFPSVKGFTKSAVLHTHPGDPWPVISELPTGHEFSFPLILPDCELENRCRAG